MTVRLPAWLQNGSYSAEIDRSIGTSLLAPAGALTSREGVRYYDGNDLKVTATGPASMQVNVGTGIAWVTGDYTTTQGSYCVVNDATSPLSVSASSSTQDRIDLVCLQVLDAVYSGVSNLAQLIVVQGTSASPGAAVAPAVPLSSICLAQVLVAKGVGSISSGAITDTRPFMSAVGGILPVLNSTARGALAGPTAGYLVREMDTLRVYQYDGSAWTYQFGGLAPPVAISLTSSFYHWPDRMNTTIASVRGTKVGSMVHLTGTMGNVSAYSAQTLAFTLPTGWWPEKTHMTSVYCGTPVKAPVRVDIQANGQVLVNSDNVSIPINLYHAFDISFNTRNNSIG